jgi:heme-degrading monooxygenase HmoA
MEMVKFTELDPIVGIRDQLAAHVEGPLVLVNVFHVDEADIDALLMAWEDDANYFKSQPGFISTQLHQGVAGSTTFLNYAVWENIEAFRSAFSSPVFQSKLANYPASAVASPHLFRKLTVKNLCVA